MIRRHALLLGGFACVLGHAPLASAAPSTVELRRARDLFAQAEKDEAAGNWSGALEKLRGAIAVKDTAGLRFHIATCEDKLGRLRAAHDDYVAAAAQAEVEHNGDVLAAIAEPLQAVRARIPSVTLVVPADVTQAVVRLDGRVLAAEELQRSVMLDPGAHHLAAEAPGRSAFDQTLNLAERDVATITLLLPKLAPSVPPQTATRADEQHDQDRRAGKEESTRPTKATTAPHPSRTLALVTTGGAVLLAAGGVGAFFLADSAQATGREDCAHGSSACDRDRTTVRTWDALALGGWIGAAGLGALATYLWLKPSAPETLAARLGLGPGSVRVEGQF